MTEAIAKGGTTEGEGVYKRLRERDQGAVEDDQRSPQRCAHGRLPKIGQMESAKTCASASASFPVSRQMHISKQGAGAAFRSIGPSSATIQSS